MNWPVGLGGKGNEGVAGQVKQTPGAIGYVELAYAHPEQPPGLGRPQQAGQFVAPSIQSTTAAAAGAAKDMPADFRVSLTNPPARPPTPSRASPGFWSTRSRPTP